MIARCDNRTRSSLLPPLCDGVPSVPAIRLILGGHKPGLRVAHVGHILVGGISPLDEGGRGEVELGGLPIQAFT